MVDPTRGVLYPGRLPQFHRLPADEDVRDLVAWFWIPEWDLEPGTISRQHVVGYPALNLVVQPEGVTLSGATSVATHRDLEGRGWAVGALLRPAAVRTLTEAPAELVDREIALAAPELHTAVVAAMTTDPERHRRATRVVADWLRLRSGPVTDADRRANAMVDALVGEDAARSPEEAASRLAVSVRTLQRLAHRYVGVAPAAMIRRRRLQDAADRLRADPRQDLAALAAELGYADHAHLSRDFTAVLGIAPSAYRVVPVGRSGVRES